MPNRRIMRDLTVEVHSTLEEVGVKYALGLSALLVAIMNP